jgi:hypothetical protein
MIPRDFDSQLKDLFFEIGPVPQAAENNDGPLLEEIVAGLFENEAVTEFKATGLTAELSPVGAPFLNANPSEHRSRVFDRFPRWMILSQIAEQNLLRFALVLLLVVTVILVGIGIPMLMDSVLLP